jgi:hypothetical protein
MDDPSNARLAGANREATRALVMACGGLLAALNGLTVATADDTATVIAQLRRSSQEVQRLADHDFDLWRFGFQERGSLWVEIGFAQLGLDDVEGAEITARALPAKDVCLNCGDYERFLADLCAALVRAGRRDAALDVLKRHYKPSVVVYHLPMIARAEAQNGDLQAAKRTFQPTLEATGKPGDCSCGPPKELDLPEALTYAAFTQLAIGDRSGTRQTVDRVESLLSKAKTKDNTWVLLSVKLAFLESKLGDSAKASQMLRDAQDAVTRLLLDRDSLWRYMAAAACRLGDMAGAQRALAKVSRDRVGEACLDLAICQWRSGDFDGAIRTVTIGDGDDYQALLLLEVAKSQAKAGDSKSAFATVARLKSDLRRAQGILEVAEWMAQHGKRDEARALARKLDYPKVERIGEHTGRHFNFEDPRTWGAGYEFFKGFTSSSMEYGWDMDGDLLAAAIRCKVALDGPATIAFTKDMNEFGWDIRKGAEAQASEGDVAGALSWAEKLSPRRRVVAIIGAAEGHAEHRMQLRPGSAKNPHLARRSHLAWFIWDRMFGEE